MGIKIVETKEREQQSKPKGSKSPEEIEFERKRVEEVAIGERLARGGGRVYGD